MNKGRPILEDMIRHVAGDREVVSWVDFSRSKKIRKIYYPSSSEDWGRTTYIPCPPKGTKWVSWITQHWAIGDDMSAAQVGRIYTKCKKEINSFFGSKVLLEDKFIPKRLPKTGRFPFEREKTEGECVAERLPNILRKKSVRGKVIEELGDSKDLVIIAHGYPKKTFVARREVIEGKLSQIDDVDFGYSLEFKKRGCDRCQECVEFHFVLRGAPERERENCFSYSSNLHHLSDHYGFCNHFAEATHFKDLALFFEFLEENRERIGEYVESMKGKKARTISTLRRTSIPPM